MINDGLVIITLIIKIIKTPVMINNIELNLHEWICWIRGGLEGRGKAPLPLGREESTILNIIIFINR